MKLKVVHETYENLQMSLQRKVQKVIRLQERSQNDLIK
jgi:hypothetical protein